MRGFDIVALRMSSVSTGFLIALSNLNLGFLVGIGFVGGGTISFKKGHIKGITTASLLLPMAVVGILVGMENLF